MAGCRVVVGSRVGVGVVLAGGRGVTILDDAPEVRGTWNRTF
jgi:hypothetical protein